MRNNRGQVFLLIEILVVAAIIVVAGLYISRTYLGRSGDDPEEAGPRTPIERAHSVDCINNLRQIRFAISIEQQTTGETPSSMADLGRDMQGQVSRCPISGEQYKVERGIVRCETPGHEEY